MQSAASQCAERSPASAGRTPGRRLRTRSMSGSAVVSMSPRILAPLAALIVLFACAAPASAARPHEFTGTLGEHCIAEPCTGAQLLTPTAVGVSEATGDIYVLDKGETGGAHGRVSVFTKEGVFVSEFDGSGTLEEGAAAGGGGQEGEIPTGRFETPEAIAVDNSCVLRKLSDSELTQKQCEEEDPSNGDVYVADTGIGHRVIDKYSADGKYLGQITTGEGPLQNEGLRGVAVDPKGTVSVYREHPGIDRFSNATPNVFVAPELQPGPFGALALQTLGFAVDSKGSFYGAVFVEGIPRAIKWDLTGKVLIEELGSGEPTGIATEQTSDTSIVDTGKRLTVFNPEGEELERLGEEGGAEHLQAGAGIGANAVEGFLYVADPLAGPVAIFGPAQPTVPKVEGQSVKDVGASETSITAEINPRSEANETATEYHFQYGRCTTPTTCESSPYEAIIPVPDGQIAPDFESHVVTTKLEGLQPASTYHFRAIARNAHGEAQASTEATFTTQGIGGELLLSDNRGWELVSPPDKQGSQIEPLEKSGVVQAAASGHGVTYLANAPTEANLQGNSNEVQVLSSRGLESWSSRDIAIPHTSATGKSGLGEGPEYKLFNRELTESAVQPFGEFIPQLSAEASESTAYLHDLSEGCGGSCFRPLVTARAGVANVPSGTVFGEEERCRPRPSGIVTLVACGPEVLGATEDLSGVVVNARNRAAHTPGFESLEGLYEWSAGQLMPVSVLPGQDAAAGGSALGIAASVGAQGAISEDGRRIVWTRNEVLYLRDTTLADTVQLDSGACGACQSGGGEFWFANADSSRAFFTDLRPLTENSGASEAKRDLYECAIVTTEGKLACELEDLTPVQGGEAAGVQGVLGASPDASRLYFVADGALSGETNANGETAQPGKPNLYLRDGGATRFIATLSGQDETDWASRLVNQPTRVSAAGRYLAFMSQARLTGYDNRDRTTGEPVAEVYLYDATTNHIACVSCDPTGERPIGVEYKKTEPGNGGLTGGFETWQPTALVAANLPGWTSMAAGETMARHQPRYLADSGRLFFNSVNALVPQDANGTQDVYQYEPPGVGDCKETSETYSARSGGCVSLISSGTSAQESAFMDASESGDDVFFLTSAKLSKLDTDSSRDVYDAHVCTTGSPCITYTPKETAACTGETSCRAPSPPEPSVFGAPASVTFEGPGNLKPTAPPPGKPKTAAQLRAEHLKHALKACKRHRRKHKRQACEKQARHRYRAKTGSATKHAGRTTTTRRKK
jgi:hypothetical protein